VRLRSLLVSGGVGHNVGRSERLRQFVIFVFYLGKSFEHCIPALIGWFWFSVVEFLMAALAHGESDPVIRRKHKSRRAPLQMGGHVAETVCGRTKHVSSVLQLLVGGESLVITR
jgi:hypothetical protein